MTAIDRKAFRDLWKIKGQALAIALVIASGVAMYIMSISNFESLRHNQRQYYDRYRFADVFAGAKRAPHWLEARIAAIPGVRALETRVVAGVTLDVEGMTEPVVGQLISVAERGGPALNDVALLEGRMLAPDRHVSDVDRPGRPSPIEDPVVLPAFHEPLSRARYFAAP